MEFGDITSRIKSFGKDTVTEVQKVTEVRQYRSQISAEKKRINAMYTEIGKKLYDEYREKPLEGFEADFHSLKVAFDTIEELRGHIRTAKGVALCPNCRMEVGINERFCSNCGCKMPEVITIEGEAQEEIPFVDQPQAASEEVEPETEAEQSASEEVAPETEAEQGAAEEVEPEAEAEQSASEEVSPEAEAEQAASEEAAPEPEAEPVPDEGQESAAAQDGKTAEASLKDETAAEASPKNEEPVEAVTDSEISAESAPESENPGDTQNSEEA